MDTISRENNSSYLPIASILVGGLALILSAVALYKANSVGKRLPANLPDRLSGVEADARTASAAADKANANIAKLQSSVQSAFENQIGPAITSLQTSVSKLEEATKSHAAPRAAATSANKKAAAPATAGPGEYIVKPGDTGIKISRTTGVSLSQLEAANPGIDWRRLRVGQKINTGAK